ncbi:MAG: tetratricopeptide repeat protein, partial [Chthoniobacteraceae bacterium]|nr:tetratricopeptide repeat protein [Chthoniobacteraceae bacterium]
MIPFATGLLAGCVPVMGLAAPSVQPRPAESSAVAGTGSEGAPKTASAAGDLALGREGERKADALAAFAQGLLAEEDGDNDRAFEAYRRSLSADANNTELAVKVAFELARRGEVSEGIGLLKDAAKASPRDPLPPLCLAQIYAQFLKKPALAIKQATTALELDPGAIGPYLVLIELYSQGGQPKKAESVLEKALKSDSKDGEFWSQLAE